MQAHRRALHRIPELGLELPKTAAYLRSVLEELPCRVFSPIEHAVCAFFDFGHDHAIALRSDMDALPITEATGLAFASCHPGRMHACGHDGHMAILLGVAQALATRRSRPRANVLLVFEPAEETCGGALPICQTGLFTTYNVREVYGLHLWPALPLHVIGSRAGGMMSRSCELTVDITGRSCHLASWQEGCDALAAAADFLQACYNLARGRSCLLRFGLMRSGQVRNAVSDSTHLEGSLRCFDDGEFEELKGRILALAGQVETATGCTFRIHFAAGYPPVCNSADLLARAGERFEIRQVEPTYLTEDFSEYQRRAPGVFFWLGTGGEALHSPRFDFDESVLETGRDLLLGLL